jgi:hypothetical protein
MSRLIDADALLEAICAEDVLKVHQCIKLVRQAPTVQREGWVSVPIEPTEEMINQAANMQFSLDVIDSKKLRALRIYKAMLQAAPKE